MPKINQGDLLHILNRASYWNDHSTTLCDHHIEVNIQSLEVDKYRAITFAFQNCRWNHDSFSILAESTPKTKLSDTDHKTTSIIVLKTHNDNNKMLYY